MLANAFGGKASAVSTDARARGAGSSVSRDDLNLGPGDPGAQPGGAAPAAAPLTGPTPGAPNGGWHLGDSFDPPGRSGSGTTVEINADDLHADSDETNNAIVVYATPRDYAVIEDALRKLDIAPSQVLIEAAIVEVTLTDKLAYGVQWAFSSNHGNGGGVLTEGQTNAVAPSYPGFSFTLPLGKGISATLSALSSLTKVKVLSAPKLLVLNNQTASLQVGDQVPIVTGSAVSTVGTNAPVVNSIDYRDTGIILKITPRVNSGGLVLLDIAQEVSGVGRPDHDRRELADHLDAGSRPRSPSRTARCCARRADPAPDRHQERHSLPRPHPGRRPALFGNNQDEHDRTELIVLLRPHVIRSAEEGLKR